MKTDLERTRAGPSHRAPDAGGAGRGPGSARETLRVESRGGSPGWRVASPWDAGSDAALLDPNGVKPVSPGHRPGIGSPINIPTPTGSHPSTR